MTAREHDGALRDPPRVVTWLVRRLCIQSQLESIEGDLLELYTRRCLTLDLKRARRRYIADALGACLRHSWVAPWVALPARRLLLGTVTMVLNLAASLRTVDWMERRLAAHPVLLQLAFYVLLVVSGLLALPLYRILASVVDWLTGTRRRV